MNRTSFLILLQRPDRIVVSKLEAYTSTQEIMTKFIATPHKLGTDLFYAWLDLKHFLYDTQTSVCVSTI